MSEEKSLGVGLHAFFMRVFGMNDFPKYQINIKCLVNQLKFSEEKDGKYIVKSKHNAHHKVNKRL